MDLAGFLSLASRTTIGLSGIFVMLGVILARDKRYELHKRVMLSAAALALLFVILYILRTALVPHGRYSGDWRSLYLFVLSSHTALSLVNLPLVVATIYLGLRGRGALHRRIAPYTAAVWIYVAFTGWVVFLFNR